jgi:rSAM/selenodomain-associated transferase 1
MERSGSSSALPFPYDRVLVIMAKAPKPGLVKTRLATKLPVSAVTALYRCFLQDTITLAKSLAGLKVAVMCPEGDQEELGRFIGADLEVVAQEGKGLAAGLTSVFKLFTAGGQRVVAFNSDSPHLSSSVLEHAFEVLASHDVVIGPTEDGGYYLVGAKAAHSNLFGNDGLGTSSALQRLLANTTAQELSTGFTNAFYDIDVAEDLLLLEEELRLVPAKAPRTAGWFREWEHVVATLRKHSGAS